MFETLMYLFLIFGISYSMKIVDLTHPLNSSSPLWPTFPKFNFTVLTRGQYSDYWFEANYFGSPEHGGTHLDAPAHFGKGKWRVHEIPIERLIGPGVIVDVVSKVNVNPDYRLLVSDIEDWESSYGKIPDGAIVIMRSGWGTRYPNKTLVFNTDQPSDPSTFHFPGFHEDTVQWLISNRNILMVGVDTPSTDYAQTINYGVHKTLGVNNIPALELLANLEKIPESGAIIFAGVINLYDGSGGPARIVAMIPEDSTVSMKFLLLSFFIGVIISQLIPILIRFISSFS